MYNGFHLPNNEQTTQIFRAGSKDWQIWRKPNSAKLIHIICIGAGGGGGGGFTRASGANGGAGGGGGSGAITRMTLDASLCPDFLHISVGLGGAGGTGSGSAGTGGGASTVTIPLVGGFNTGGSILTTATGGGGGGAGTGAAGGAAGIAGAIVASTTYSTLGVYTSIAGQAGTLGGFSTTAPVAVAWGSLFISGGAGGGGINTGNTEVAGANVTQSANPQFQTIAGGVVSGGTGNPGVEFFNRIPISSGGSGGGSNNNGVGGRGGNGGFGSGGGGGATGITGGAGGKGGDGLIIITYV